MKKRRSSLLWVHIALCILVVITYLNGFTNDFTSDDISLFTNSNALGNWSFVTTQGVYFLQPLIYVIVYKIFGAVAIWYRLITVLLHIVSVEMIFMIVSCILSPVAAVFAASLFAVHPLLVESVTWISGGPYAWSTSFFLLSLYWYIHFRSSNKKSIYIFSIIAYFLSLSVGLTATALAAAFLLYEFCFGNIKKNWKELIPYFALAILYALVALSALNNRIDSFQGKLAWEIPQYSLLNIPFIVSKYIELYILPIKLSHYQVDVLGNPLRLVVFAMFVAGIIYSYLKNKYIFFGLSFFLISLLPTLVPIGVHWLVAERYVYAGLFGMAFVTGWFFYYCSLRQGFRTATYIVFAAYILLLQIRTIMRNDDWKNELNLWKATVQTSPADAKGHNNLANAYISQGKYRDALGELKIAIQLKPDYSDAYLNIGLAYDKIGNMEEADRYYRLALTYNPQEWQAYHNIGLLYNKKKQYMIASDYIKKAIKINPQYALLHTDLGVMYYFAGKKQEAQQAFLQALALDPTSQMATLGYQESLK